MMKAQVVIKRKRLHLAANLSLTFKQSKVLILCTVILEMYH